VYCDFSIAVRPNVPHAEYLGALGKEWRVRHGDSSFTLDTLYFGGGTPSKLGGPGVGALLELVRDHARLRGDAEVTLEANPEDVSPDSVRSWRESGVNRVSVGVQSFDDGVLTWMHRTHDSVTARRAIDVLRDEGITNISIDLIFATPDGIARSWRNDLDAAIAFDLPHVSVYGLTVEDQTPLGRWVARDEVSEAPEEKFEREFTDADRELTAAGFEHYEVSNYGRPGFHSRHNWAYWRRHSYGGLGPSAHEFDGESRRWNTSPYAGWISTLSRAIDPIEGSERLAAEQHEAERVYLGLRTSDGVPVSEGDQEHFDRWIDSGWAILTEDARLRLTAAGWLRLDSLANDLTLVRSRY
jgi:oxygen-independent coproporphyrinogen-3 oxidase